MRGQQRQLQHPHGVPTVPDKRPDRQCRLLWPPEARSTALPPQCLPGKLTMAPGQLEAGARYWTEVAPLGDSLAGREQRCGLTEKPLQPGLQSAL